MKSIDFKQAGDKKKDGGTVGSDNVEQTHAKDVRCCSGDGRDPSQSACKSQKFLF